MKKAEVMQQLCKMLGEVARKLGTESTCICDQMGWKNAIDEVPDVVIEDLWKLIADGYLFRDNRQISCPTPEKDPDSAYTRGYMAALQDDCENCQFASSGGAENRNNMKAPGYIPEDQEEEYLRGYRAYCDKHYVDGWETVEWWRKEAKNE